MSVTIEPTVTPAPKPEWVNPVTGYLVGHRDKSVMLAPDVGPDTEDRLREMECVILATVVILSSADCERKAAALAELEQASMAMELDGGQSNRFFTTLFRDWLEARRKVRDLLTPKGTNP